MAAMTFGPLTFPNKTTAQKGFRELLQSVDLGQPIKEPWNSALLALMELHPSKPSKIGCGIQHFEVRTHYWQEKFLQRGFYIVRTDGSSVDFSYLICFKPAASLAHATIVEACREAVAEDVHAFKKSIFGNAHSVKCAETGESVSWPDAHVDHAEPWPFRRILEQWLAEIGSMPEVAHSDAMNHRLADPAQADAFCRFHNERACLRIVHRTVNLGWRKKSA